MANRASKPEESKPFDYFKEVKAAQKQEKPNISNLVNNLRSDMVPASNVQPARESAFHRDNIKVAVGILLGLVILGMILYTAIGPGRPILENNLASLAGKKPTLTPTPSATPTPPTSTPILPTNTAISTPTIRPTRTSVIASITSPTSNPPTATSTQAGCREVTSITLADVGQTLCVWGVLFDTKTTPTAFMMFFSEEPGAFYWASYDLVWSKADVDTCYQVTGKIERMANNPILVFNYSNLPEVCP